MPNVIKYGSIPEPPAPWWENTMIHCGICESVFLLDQADFDTEQWVERQELKLDGHHTVEGRCPVCKAPMLIDVKELLRATSHPRQEQFVIGAEMSAATVRAANLITGVREGHDYLEDPLHVTAPERYTAKGPPTADGGDDTA